MISTQSASVASPSLNFDFTSDVDHRKQDDIAIASKPSNGLVKESEKRQQTISAGVHAPPLATKSVPQDKYQFAHSDKYPPYLKSIPSQLQVNAFQIFDLRALLKTKALSDTPSSVFSTLWQFGLELAERNSLQAIMNFNNDLHAELTPEDWIGAMFDRENIGNRNDWYTDALFGQQQFTGSNPTTITRASPRWIDEFKTASETQKRDDVAKLLKDHPQNFFVQDYSDFRSVVGLSPTAELTSEGRYGCSSVALFYLEPEGKLHPLAITIDYKGRMENSVTIFNRRFTSSTPGNQAADFPWRYAKMCVQTSDWLRQEITAHLVNTHLVEEVIIVAAYRTLDPRHIVFQLLEPHWKITLSLNSEARNVLVPDIITSLVGFTATQTYAFIKDAYNKFNWKDSYVPNDLRRRGFPIEELDQPKYHNYGYARNIARMWKILRSFVAMALAGTYATDAQVANDKSISAFCREVRSQDQGQLSSFPDVKTLDELIDVVTMCIHIASPQHSAVNYLQQYYQTFVPNKPGSLYARLPQSLAQLQKVVEEDIISALPLHRPKEWLLMAQVPYLLSFEVPGDSNLLQYAIDASKSGPTPDIRHAAGVLKKDLDAFVNTVAQYSRELDDQKTPYLVLDPSNTAVSILI